MNNVVAAEKPAFSMNVKQFIANAARVGKQSQHVAAAAYVFLPREVNCQSLCVWCAEKRPDAQAQRLPAGGECDACPYVGRDCLVVWDGE